MPWDQGAISEAFLLRVNPAQKQRSKFQAASSTLSGVQGWTEFFWMCTIGIFYHVLVHGIKTPAAFLSFHACRFSMQMRKMTHLKGGQALVSTFTVQLHFVQLRSSEIQSWTRLLGG